jgi:transposase
MPYLLGFASPKEIEVIAALATGWEHIRFIKRQMKRLDKHIACYIDPVPNPIITIKGAVITAGILAKIVDVTRFAEHKHLAQYSGLTWEKRSSGNFVSQSTRLTKAGSKYLRYYLIMGANTLRQFNLDLTARLSTGASTAKWPSISTSVPSSSPLVNSCVWCMPCSQRTFPM